jgi:hypothetical protein
MRVEPAVEVYVTLLVVELMAKLPTAVVMVLLIVDMKVPAE